MRRGLASGVVATLGLAMASLLAAAPAQAQVSGCESIQKLLVERQSIVSKLQAAQKAKKKMTPQEACSTFGRLVNNGEAAIKFATANQDWCQIPPTFIDGMKADNQKVVTFRSQACNAVKQQAEMIRRAQKQAQGANPFGGADSVTSGAGGGLRVPQGAL
ncbi:conserved exported hypothetical protein [Hyphomicrobiales bacterium]|nr:conserved exported hypothetical protein [Hyphomicrobiales bacterium]CAH1700998.1 conserved exported hypothetical protein [Hyphomicrobiales bacterium]CAI0344876.1 conserved exported hypothetical protein [Hyphomicrobiales bacterium]